MQVYGTDEINLSYPYGDSTPLSARGWHGPLGSAQNIRNRQRVRLTGGGGGSTPTAYRYYLVWLTTLPPGQESASISELTLFK